MSAPRPLFNRPLRPCSHPLRPAILQIRTALLTSMSDARQAVDALLDLGNPNPIFLQQNFVLSLGFFVFLWQMPETLHRPPQRFVTLSEPFQPLVAILLGNPYSANIAPTTARTATACGAVSFPTRFTSRARSTVRI
jgi:hypothetical protein